MKIDNVTKLGEYLLQRNKDCEKAGEHLDPIYFTKHIKPWDTKVRGYCKHCLGELSRYLTSKEREEQESWKQNNHNVPCRKAA